MRALVQRVSHASVSVEGSPKGEIENGLLIFVGMAADDTRGAPAYLAQKCVNLRIFEDEAGKMNRSVRDVGGSALVISQFTLYAETDKGNRPFFGRAAEPAAAMPLYEQFVMEMRKELGTERVQTGEFRAMMDVRLVNRGPVTIMIESKDNAS